MPVKGTCLCGQTTINLDITLDATSYPHIACHCLDCQHTSGSAFSSNIIVPETLVNISGTLKSYESKSAKGNTMTRIFCSTCGSAIAHKSVFMGDAMAIQTGNLSDFSNVEFAFELFMKNRWTGVGPFPGVIADNQKQAME